ITRLWVATGLLLVVGAYAFAAQGLAIVPPLAGHRPAAPPEAPRISSVQLSITDPAYLGGRSRTAAGDADAPEGARLAFSVDLYDAATAWLLTTNGDSLPVTEGPLRPLTAERSFLYQVVAVRDTFRVTTEWRRVTVHPDRAPQLTVVRP